MIRGEYTGFVERCEDFLSALVKVDLGAGAGAGTGTGAARRVTWRPSAAT